MRQIMIMISLLALSLSTIPAAADDAFHPMRFRPLIHSAIPVHQSIEIRSHFILSANLAAGATPYGFVGVGFPLLNCDIEVLVGADFKNSEGVLSARVQPSYKRFWVWADIEFQPQSKSLYWFVQAQFKVLPWLHLGVEEESWGDGRAMDLRATHGGGPNALFRVGQAFGWDMALHIRNFPDEGTRPELFVRIHIFMPKPPLPSKE